MQPLPTAQVPEYGEKLKYGKATSKLGFDVLGPAPDRRLAEARAAAESHEFLVFGEKAFEIGLSLAALRPGSEARTIGNSVLFLASLMEKPLCRKEGAHSLHFPRRPQHIMPRQRRQYSFRSADNHSGWLINQALRLRPNEVGPSCD